MSWVLVKVDYEESSHLSCWANEEMVDELQNTIEDEQKSLMEEMRMAMDDQKNAIDDDDGRPVAMSIE
ncbi:hypothetical protein LIER_09030 [Lithospermum erythrorhizon]|uniref:Uncharacterized protein n=1 Tax=Lithospermum erythrorhizon TaxID=34254 RepID=A0AAV3PED7_LITER